MLIVWVESIVNGESKMVRSERMLYRPIAMTRHDCDSAHATLGQVVELILDKSPPPTRG